MDEASSFIVRRGENENVCCQCHVDRASISNLFLRFFVVVLDHCFERQYRVLFFIFVSMKVV